MIKERKVKPFLCKTCGQNDPACFYKGHKSACKKCCKDQGLVRTHGEVRRTVQPPNCTHCGTTNIANFYKQCKSCCKSCTVRLLKEDPVKYKKLKEQVARWRADNRFRSIWLGARNRSKHLNRKFTITTQDLELLWKQQDGMCYYTGTEMDLTSNDRHNTMSIDRLDSSRGYEPDNIVLCKCRCNMMKSDLPLQEWYNLMREILKYNGQL